MGKAEENKRQKKSALLEHAFSLFMKNGISSTTISEIANHAGVGKGTFYSYFRDKDELIEKLIAQKAGELLTHALDDLANHKDALSVEDKFVVIADDLLEQLTLDEKLPKFINKNLNYGLYRRALTREDSEINIESVFFELIDDGSEWVRPDLMLYTVVELVGSTCHTIILDKDPVDLETYKPYLYNCVRNIVKTFRINGEN